MFKLEFFIFSLRGRAKKWFKALPNEHKDSLINCKAAFMLKFNHPEIDFDNCNLSEVMKFLQRMTKDPHTSKLNMAFTEHITNALIKAKEEKLRLEISIP